MPQPLRLLVVEDHPFDAEIVLRELRQAGFEPTWTRVETEEAFREHLSPELDLILSDFELPRFTGRRALEVLQERQLRVPFIVISGTIRLSPAREGRRSPASPRPGHRHHRTPPGGSDAARIQNRRGGGEPAQGPVHRDAKP